MSEPKRISPLLDGFDMGNPISEHNGIRCCPAIKENTDKKYIVKIIAIPASQAQMDALLLAGAYKDPSGAMDYFQEKGEDVLKEAELLKTLSRLDGFLSYEGWQMEPITRHRLGYEIYLVGSYKRSLDRYIRHHAVTHLEAINLGLDMCNALSVCRQAGALYVDLKPSNIFMSEKKEYRIGDLGFLSLDSLRYAALPEKYQSSYTPPELYDPMASVNMTADTYALGMILYQLYNDGSLPFRGKAPEDGLPSPAHADYELAEIIMKAIHPDPEERWTDPAEMGKALASYMQRNSINDVPITPLRMKRPKRKKDKEEPAVQEDTEVSTEPVTEPDIETPLMEETETPEPLDESAEAAEILPDAIDEEEDALLSEEADDLSAESPEDGIPADMEELLTEPEEESAEAENAESEQEPEVIEDAAEPEETEPEPVPEEPEIPEAEEELVLSEELSRIFAKADDLIAHETPEGVQLPELPEEPDPFAFVLDEEEIDESDVPVEPLMEEETEEPEPQKKKKQKKYADPKYKRRRKRFVSALLSIIVLVLIGMGAFWYYQNQYLQTIHALTITGDRSQITVQVDTQIDEKLLSVTCQDNYGTSKTADLKDGQAVFTGLQPNTMYTIRLDIEGFHGLVGKTSDIFTTDATTNIVSFTSIAGAEDGSVVLSFTVDGNEPDHWAVVYSAEGEEENHKTFQGHSVTINGLTLGKVYTFRLESSDHESLGGTTTLELMASRLILAENISITSTDGTDMTIRWEAPGDVVVDSWNVRCYNDRGYDESQTVTETEILFSGIDPSVEYSIEITAAGMTQPARTGITANPISVQSLSVDESNATYMEVSWDYTGVEPEDGWLVTYTVDGSDSHVVKSAKSSAKVSPLIPGANYEFTIHAADGTSIFNNVHSHETSEASTFAANALNTDMLTIDLLKTPEEQDWRCENITDDQFTDRFQSGDSISIALRSNDSFYYPGSRTQLLYVIRDSYGNVLGDHTHHQELIWKDIWNGGDSKNGELTLPSTPTIPGEYTLNLYFDGMQVAELPFNIS